MEASDRRELHFKNTAPGTFVYASGVQWRSPCTRRIRMLRMRIASRVRLEPSGTQDGEISGRMK
jgi:hypothetical protein